MKFKGSSRDEISKRIVTARHFSEQARIPGHSPAISFQLAYEAARMWCEVVVRAQGLRIEQPRGRHEQTIKAMADCLGDNAGSIAKHLNKARQLRNKTMYEGELGHISRTEADELLDILDRLTDLVTAWLKEKHPDLMPLA